MLRLIWGGNFTSCSSNFGILSSSSHVWNDYDKTCPWVQSTNKPSIGSVVTSIAQTIISWPPWIYLHRVLKQSVVMQRFMSLDKQEEDIRTYDMLWSLWNNHIMSAANPLRLFDCHGRGIHYWVCPEDDKTLLSNIYRWGRIVSL